MFRPTSTRQAPHNPQDGFALVGLIVAIFIILLVLSVAAPTVARALRREREVEAVHRADEYIKAIRRYHLKTGAYPGSIEQLEKTNNIRYIRQKYSNPMTGKPDWRLIKVGENKTTVKGFFGQPLAGLANTGIGGSSPGMSNTTNGLTGGTTPGSTASSPSGSNSSAGATSSSTGAVSGAADSTGPSGFGSPMSSNSSSPGSSGGIGSSPTGSSGIGGSSSGSGAPFLGVGVPTAGAAIIVVNEQTTYPEWEFLYDPRIEQLRAKVNIFGGGMSSTSSSGLGSLSNNQSNMPTSTGSPTTPPPTPTPNTPQ